MPLLVLLALVLPVVLVLELVEPPVPPAPVEVVVDVPVSSSLLAPHEPASAPAAVSPRSTAAAVRGMEPSVRRSGSPQLGHVTSVLFAWQ
jgi:hypothetical protein